LGVFLQARYRMAVKCSDVQNISWHLSPNNHRGTSLIRNNPPPPRTSIGP